jgi:predicted metal-binding membrane protein
VAAALYVAVAGLPPVSERALIGSVAWMLYTLPSVLDVVEPFDVNVTVGRKTKQVAACWAFAAGGLLIYQSQAWLLGGYHAAVSQAGVGATVGSVVALLIALADV